MKLIRSLLLITFCAGMIVIAQPGSPSATAKMHAPAKQKQAITTAAQVNGTWRYGKNEFKIWALGERKLRVEFSGIYEYRWPAGPTADTDEGNGIATIEGDTAIFKPEVSDAECRITLKFVGA